MFAFDRKHKNAQEPKLSEKKNAQSSPKPDYSGGSIADATNGSPIIYGHDTSSIPGNDSLSKSIRGIERYAERALILARDKDTVLLNKRPDPDYIRYLHAIKLHPSNIIQFNSENIYDGLQRNKHITRNEMAYYAPYFSGERDLEVAKRITSKMLAAPENIILKYYDKAQFKEVCKQNKISVAAGEVFTRSLSRETDKRHLKALIQKYLPSTGEVIVRETGLASGVSMEFANKKNIDSVVENIINSTGRKYLVEVKENVVDSPSLIGYISNNSFKILAQTTQLLDEKLFYLGNLIEYDKPVHPMLQKISQKIGTEMLKDGYMGAFGIDFIQTDKNQFYPVECNARVTGAFYPHETRQRLLEKGMTFQVSMSFSHKIPPFTNFKQFSEHTKIAPMLYRGDNTPGILPLNVDGIKDGKFAGIILANTKTEALNLQKKFQEIQFSS